MIKKYTIFSLVLLLLCCKQDAKTSVSDNQIESIVEDSTVQTVELNQSEPEKPTAVETQDNEELVNIGPSTEGPKKESPLINISEQEDIDEDETESESTETDVADNDVEQELDVEEEKLEEPVIEEKSKPDHEIFNKLLKQYVDSKGSVDYAKLKQNQNELNAYLNELDKFAIEAHWTKNEKLAYWINVYNAYTLKLIIDNYPVQSIMDIANGKPWDKKWIMLAGKTYSLNQIENEIIRPVFKDARIHFAVNCAAKSCPPLANQAFTADNIQSLLESRTKEFINNPAFTKIDDKQIKLSKIFDWYAEDFGDVKSYVSNYYKARIPNVEISYFTYDWNLNGK